VAGEYWFHSRSGTATGMPPPARSPYGLAQREEEHADDKLVERSGRSEQNCRSSASGAAGEVPLYPQITTIIRTQQHEPHRVQNDVQVLQLVDQWDTALFQRLVHGGIASCAGKEDNPVSEMG
jgi:hypothetical protein